MALTTTKNITIAGTCTVDDTIIERYTAVINQSNPENMNISHVQVSKSMVKANIETCREDRAAFEDLAYSTQDEVIAEAGETDDEVTA